MNKKSCLIFFPILILFLAGFIPSPKQNGSKATINMSSDQLNPNPSPNPQSPIRITAEIPSAPANMSLYKLTTNRAPVDFFNEKLGKANLPSLNLDKQRYVVRSGNDIENGLHAFIDMRSGDAEFVPDLADVVKTVGNMKAIGTERVVSLARAAFTDERFIPKDATELKLTDPITISGGANADPKSNGVRKEPTQMMTIVPAVRYAGGFKVYGLGSHAVVTFNNEGTIIGAVRRWRLASVAETVKPSITIENVRREIMRQLQPMVRSKGTEAIVDKIEIAYYDNNKEFLQPVYHFEATVQPSDKRISPVRTSGFIPMVQPREQIPDLTRKEDGATPGKAPVPNPKLPRNGVGGDPTPDDITLGEYCNRDWPNDNGYISMSYAFLNGLTFFNSIFPGFTPPTTRTQWYEAWPWELVGPNSKYYFNAVNVAYTVPHGDWLINTTMSNNADLWYVGDIGTGGNPGLGHAAGNGVCATWVIMSCEVIPSFYDRAHEAGGSGNGYDAFNVWWGVFQGLHNALGFRTIMFYPDTNTNFAFGQVASLGCDVNAAWFQEVAAYHGGDGTYPSQHLSGGPQVHYDRASSMIDARNLGQSIFNVTPQSAAGTLWNFWMNN